jgi:pSer/pThr/pTyr-binding forkhead associated (FHA) protein
MLWRTPLMSHSTDKTTLPGTHMRSTAGAGGTELAIVWVYPEIEGRVMPLPQGTFVIGRGDDVEVQLLGAEVSRRHARINVQGMLVTVLDLGSRNGVVVNGARVEQAALTPGTVLRLGEWVGVFCQRPGPVLRRVPLYGPIAPGYLGGPATRAALEPLERVATTDLPIIVEGETGTGKEGAARAAHLWSGRTGPFIAVNCAALPDAMAEGELFGYRKGAFTGADRDNPGHFRAANGGTLFLDEVVDLPAAVQPKLLRVIEQREVLPLGESRPHTVDVRVVAAAQIPLSRAVEDKRFRADLYARLDGLTVQLPPLRERIEEVPFLFASLLKRHGKGVMPELDPSLIEQLCLYDWPFNVREIDLLVRRTLALRGTSARLSASLLPDRMRRTSPRRPTAEAPPVGAKREEVTLETFLEALRVSKGNVSRAAAALGITRQKAYRMMDEAPDIDLASFRQSDG